MPVAVIMAVLIYCVTQVTMMWLSRRAVTVEEEVPDAIGFECGGGGEDDDDED